MVLLPFPTTTVFIEPRNCATMCGLPVEPEPGSVPLPFRLPLSIPVLLLPLRLPLSDPVLKLPRLLLPSNVPLFGPVLPQPFRLPLNAPTLPLPSSAPPFRSPLKTPILSVPSCAAALKSPLKAPMLCDPLPETVLPRPLNTPMLPDPPLNQPTLFAPGESTLPFDDRGNRAKPSKEMLKEPRRIVAPRLAVKTTWATPQPALTKLLPLPRTIVFRAPPRRTTSLPFPATTQASPAPPQMVTSSLLAMTTFARPFSMTWSGEDAPSV